MNDSVLLKLLTGLLLLIAAAVLFLPSSPIEETQPRGVIVFITAAAGLFFLFGRWTYYQFLLLLMLFLPVMLFIFRFYIHLPPSRYLYETGRGLLYLLLYGQAGVGIHTQVHKPKLRRIMLILLLLCFGTAALLFHEIPTVLLGALNVLAAAVTIYLRKRSSP